MKDEKVAEILNNEVLRQTEGLELIPSENYVSKDVLTALGSVLTNKYAEGYPGRRYYGGQENTDAIERLAIERAKKLFGADHANVQPHSGAAANEAVYSAWLKPGDTVLAMDLSHGGHLTHGAAVTRGAAKDYFSWFFCIPTPVRLCSVCRNWSGSWGTTDGRYCAHCGVNCWWRS